MNCIESIEIFNDDNNIVNKEEKFYEKENNNNICKNINKFKTNISSRNTCSSKLYLSQLCIECKNLNINSTENQLKKEKNRIKKKKKNGNYDFFLQKKRK